MMKPIQKSANGAPSFALPEDVAPDSFQSADAGQRCDGVGGNGCLRCRADPVSADSRGWADRR